MRTWGRKLSLAWALAAVPSLGALAVACATTLHPRDSVQGAIDAAPEGAVICLGEGVWRERITISQPVTLQGAGVGRTALVAELGGEGPVIRVTGEGTGKVVLRGLAIRGGSGLHGHGIAIGGRVSVVIEESALEENALWGVWIGGSAVVRVQSSTVRGNGGGGVWVGDWAELELRGTHVSDSGGSGILIAGSATVVLRESRVTGNREYGVVLDGTKCRGEGEAFAGLVVGGKNLIPWPGLDGANVRGSVCPDELGFLMTEAGGSLDRRTVSAAPPSSRIGLRFLIRAQGLEGLPPGRQRELMDQLVTVVKDRLDLFGFSDVALRRVGQDQVEVAVFGTHNAAPVRALLTQRSVLSFHKVLDVSVAADAWAEEDPARRVLPSRDRVEWYLVEAEPLLTGDVLDNAVVRTSTDPRSPGFFIALTFNREGAERFVEALRRVQVNDRLAIVLDNVVYSAPAVTSSIKQAAAQGWRAVQGSTTITGRFTLDEAKLLAVVLRSGALPVEVFIVEESQY